MSRTKELQSLSGLLVRREASPVTPPSEELTDGPRAALRVSDCLELGSYDSRWSE